MASLEQIREIALKRCGKAEDEGCNAGDPERDPQFYPVGPLTGERTMLVFSTRRIALFQMMEELSKGAGPRALPDGTPPTVRWYAEQLVADAETAMASLGIEGIQGADGELWMPYPIGASFYAITSSKRAIYEMGLELLRWPSGRPRTPPLPPQLERPLQRRPLGATTEDPPIARLFPPANRSLIRAAGKAAKEAAEMAARATAAQRAAKAARRQARQAEATARAATAAAKAATAAAKKAARARDEGPAATPAATTARSGGDAGRGLRRNCDYCCMKKRKCSRGHPCELCLRSGEVCRFSFAKAPGPRTGAKALKRAGSSSRP